MAGNCNKSTNCFKSIFLFYFVFLFVIEYIVSTFHFYILLIHYLLSWGDCFGERDNNTPKLNKTLSSIICNVQSITFLSHLCIVWHFGFLRGKNNSVKFDMYLYRYNKKHTIYEHTWLALIKWLAFYGGFGSSTSDTLFLIKRIIFYLILSL